MDDDRLTLPLAAYEASPRLFLEPPSIGGTQRLRQVACAVELQQQQQQPTLRYETTTALLFDVSNPCYGNGFPVTDWLPYHEPVPARTITLVRYAQGKMAEPPRRSCFWKVEPLFADGESYQKAHHNIAVAVIVIATEKVATIACPS